MPLPDVNSVLRDGDGLIVVPPFAGLDRPSLAAHVLQACAAEAGIRVNILYASLLFGAQIGELNYQAVCYAPTGALLGERFFARAAYDVPAFGHDTSYTSYFEASSEEERAGSEVEINLDELQALEPLVQQWVDTMATAIAARGYKVVGCTSTFEQTAASVALLNRIKQLRPETVTVIGGANCDGEMAEGILSLGAGIDYVFAGESEVSFVTFMRRVLSGDLPAERIIAGEPCMNLDALPTTDFSEYYEQLALAIPESLLAKSSLILLPYESSRGCWWGEKHHCTFCGLNAQTMKHREKSPDRVIGELQCLLKKHPNKKVCVVDNIMPHSYFRTLLPRLPTEVPGLIAFYEEKSNLSLEDVVNLKAAGVCEIQPGIEALSTSLLRRMDKGVTARQNIALMRYARAVGLNLAWNLLYAFPGDRAADYEETLSLIPLLRHLNPPAGLSFLSIDRFSPYFDFPDRYGITNMQPMKSYFSVFPDSANIEKLAYHFLGDYSSGSRETPELMKRLEVEVDHWVSLWSKEDEALPALAVTSMSEETFLLMDTRGLEETEEIQFLDRDQAALVLAGRRLDEQDDNVDWALEAKLIVELDHLFVPLATAEPALLREFESELRTKLHGSVVRRALPVIPAVVS
jgi:ribosomal peptide maturation radical SAM protein 1